MCEQGGGILKGKYFCYVNVSPANSRSEVLDDDIRKKRTRHRSNKPDAIVKHNLLTITTATLPIVLSPTARSSSVPSPSSPSLYVPKESPRRWDLSMLKPVRKKANPGTRPRKLIEVVNTQTNDVLVCFRGTTDACRALSLSRSEVATACDAHGEVERLVGYRIRFGDSLQPPKAYEFGLHKVDFTQRIETHEARLERFKQMHADDMGSLNDAARTLANQALERTGTVGERIAMMALPQSTNNDMICMVCQVSNVQVAFEPCFHCVLCLSCSQTACQIFCPLCRTPITSRVQPTTAQLVRPRIYSAYSFI